MHEATRLLKGGHNPSSANSTIGLSESASASQRTLFGEDDVVRGSERSARSGSRDDDATYVRVENVRFVYGDGSADCEFPPQVIQAKAPQGAEMSTHRSPIWTAIALGLFLLARDRASGD